MKGYVGEAGREARDWDWENQPFTTTIARPEHSEQGGGRRHCRLMRVHPQSVDFLWRAIKAAEGGLIWPGMLAVMRRRWNTTKQKHKSSRSSVEDVSSQSVSVFETELVSTLSRNRSWRPLGSAAGPLVCRQAKHNASF